MNSEVQKDVQEEQRNHITERCCRVYLIFDDREPDTADFILILDKETPDKPSERPFWDNVLDPPYYNN